MAADTKPAGGKPVEAVALEPIRHNGQKYAPGAVLQLEPEQYEQLATMGKVESTAEARARARALRSAREAEEKAAADKAAAEAEAARKAAEEAARKNGGGNG